LVEEPTMTVIVPDRRPSAARVRRPSLANGLRGVLIGVVLGAILAIVAMGAPATLLQDPARALEAVYHFALAAPVGRAGFGELPGWTVWQLALAGSAVLGGVAAIVWIALGRLGRSGAVDAILLGAILGAGAGLAGFGGALAALKLGVVGACAGIVAWLVAGDGRGASGATLRKLRVVRWWDRPQTYPPQDILLVEAPMQWAPAMRSLLSLSDAHRNTGLIVTNVGPDSSAAAGGIRRGDILLRYDGVPLDSINALLRRAGRADAGGGRVKVDALRRGKELTFELSEGPLGLTVSTLLHQLRLGRLGARRGLRLPAAPSLPRQGQVTLIEVRGELVNKAVRLLAILEMSPVAGQRKKARALLLAAVRAS
jgi:hypothetical protein